MVAFNEFFKVRAESGSVAFADRPTADRDCLTHPRNRVTALAEDLRDLGVPLLRFCYGRQHATRVAGTDVRELREIEDEHSARALLRDALEARGYALKREHRGLIKDRATVLADHILAARALEHLRTGRVECADTGFLAEILSRELRCREADDLPICEFAVPALHRHQGRFARAGVALYEREAIP